MPLLIPVDSVESSISNMLGGISNVYVCLSTQEVLGVLATRNAFPLGLGSRKRCLHASGRLCLLVHPFVK